MEEKIMDEDQTQNTQSVIKRRNRIILVASSVLVCLCLGCGSTIMLTPDNANVDGQVETNSITFEETVLETSLPPENSIEATDAFEGLEENDVPTATSVPKPTNVPQATDTPKPTATTQPTNTPKPTNTPLPSGMAWIEGVDGQTVLGEEATVNYVVDGDTINVLLNGEEYRVRYIGMDTPEQGEPFFEDATRANRRLVENQTVIMVKDVSETDRYARLLRYIYLPDGTMVNLEMVRLGFAQTATYPPDVYYEDLFTEMQREAISSGRGLWAQPVATNTAAPLPTNTAAPLPTPTAVPAPVPESTPVPQPTEPPPPPAANCDPSYPDVCIPPYPPDLDCGDIPYRRFRVLPPDPHGFDRDHDGIGCES